MKTTTFKLAALAMAMTLSTNSADAQGFLKAIKDRAVQTVKDKVDNKVDETVNKTTDRILNGKVKKAGKASDAEAPEEDAKQDTPKNEQLKGSTVSDFKPGDKVLFQDDFSQDPVGEYPAKWEVTLGSVDIYDLKGTKCANVGTGEMRPYIEPDVEKYLSSEYTIEIEYYGTYNNDRVNDLVIDFYGDDNKSTSLRNREADVYTVGDITTSFDNKASLGWNTIQISYNNGAFKVYRNGQRVVNRNRVPQYNYFIIKGESNDEGSTYLRKVTICLGAKEKYEQKATEVTAIQKAIEESGKFVTNNILFETGKADLKSESMEEIKKVADYMKTNPSARFLVQGHCDNQGSDAINDPLSQKRSEAIVKALVELGVDEFNLKAEGKGSHEPVADNKTEEGRAKNRRVEFIKK